MSQLKFMEKLLAGAEVEWKLLDDVGEFLRGKRFVKSDMLSEGEACIHYGEMYTHYGIWADNARSYLSADIASRLRVANPGDVIIVAAGETIEDIGNGTAWLGERDVVFHDACFSFKSTLDPKYVAHYLRTHLFKEQIKSSISSGKISSINAKGLGKAKIPIPCPEDPKKSLTIQAEIVNILDILSERTSDLATGLASELNSRKKQYCYYRDQLLSFEEGEANWKSLGDLCAIGDGLHGTPKYDEDGEYYFINGNNLVNGNIVFKERTKKVNHSMFEKHGISFDPHSTIFLSINGTIGNVSFYKNEKVVLGKSVAFFKIESSELRLKYLFYFLQTEFSQRYFEANKTGAGVKNLGLKPLRLFKIPIPPVEEQDRVIDLLDKYDKLTKSITEDLSREIELRQKQYEHYRDLLFSFSKPKVVA